MFITLSRYILTQIATIYIIQKSENLIYDVTTKINKMLHIKIAIKYVSR